jgi:hypothetical protein
MLKSNSLGLLICGAKYFVGRDAFVSKWLHLVVEINGGQQEENLMANA